MIFRKEKITLDCDELARELKSDRERRKITPEKAAEITRIGRRHIELMESGCFEKLPGGIYRKKILEEYASYLGVACRDLLENQTKENSEEGEKTLFFSQKTKNNPVHLPKITKNVIIALTFAACLFYLGAGIEKIARPPELSVYNPPENLVAKEKSIKIIGQSEEETEITINGENILANENGFFQKTVSLKSGVNTIKISAKKKHSRENTVTREVLVQK